MKLRTVHLAALLSERVDKVGAGQRERAGGPKERRAARASLLLSCRS